jgi:hypothetical protein
MEILTILLLLSLIFIIILLLILQSVITERDCLYLDSLRKDSRIEYLTAGKKQ